MNGVILKGRMVAFELPGNFVVWTDNLGSLSIDDGAMEDYDIMFNAKGDGFMLEFCVFTQIQSASRNSHTCTTIW